MTPAELLGVLADRNITVWIEDGRLRFRAPRGALTPELRELLQQHKDGLMAALRGPASPLPAVHTLSHNQQFLWFLYQLAPQSSAYNVAFVARVVSPVDRPRLQAAFQELVGRHPMLRTTYEAVDGIPSMRIHEKPPLACEFIDAAGWSEDELARRVRERYGEPFDLEKGPILRVQLFTASPENHVLLLNIHHIACDGGSIGILMREFRDLYAHGPDAGRPEPGAPYTDFTRFQSEMVQGPQGERLLGFWKQQLAGELPELNLPIDKPRPRVRIPRGGTHHFQIDGELYQGLVTLARRSGATLYALLLASFQTLLMRLCAQDDILIGTPMAGRPRKEDESTVGCYINPVVLRGRLSGEETFQELLARTRRIFTDALENRHYPFPVLVERLSPVRDPSRLPIFEVLFNLLSRKTLGDVADLLFRDKTTADLGDPVDFGDLKMRPFPMDQEEGQFDLVLEMIDNAESLTGLIKYSTDLFEETTIVRLAGSLETLLRGIVADPSCRLRDLPLLSESERRKVLVDWNQTDAAYRTDLCLHTLFEDQVQKTPEAVAIVFEGVCLTYRELDLQAERLARRLRARGVGPEVPVGVHLERSLEMVVALYAILKAGGAYVPLDPEYPKDRLAFMLNEIHSPVILTQTKLAGGLPDQAAAVICLDDLDRTGEESGPEEGKTPVVRPQPENMAYVIYTSGSTGRPKGVVNTHRGICNRLLWMQEAFGLTPEDVVLQKTPYSFDVSVWEFFWPLMVGARLVVARPGGHRDSAYLAELIAAQKVTTLHFVPSMLELFLEDPAAGSCRSLKRVICSGEALSYELQERFFAVIDGELHNLYGPTEAAVDVSWWACRRGDTRRIVPIGRPVANTRLYVLDGRMQPVPVGVSGELYIGGVQVARGYLGRPELTAERFVADPFSGDPGATLYRTGDLCRHLPDGTIEYLGRNDFQVKIRGLRIELGEIEANLRQVPGVREAVVLAREDTPGDKRLVAYFTASPASEISAAELRSYLKIRLAEYMIPAAFVPLAEFPLTSSGKVDRRALPVPEGTRQTERAFVAPRGETERRVAGIWQDLLRVDAVGLDDNFFDLGGHSLLIVRMVARLKEAFRRDLSVVDLFQHPTVREQAELLGGPEPGDRPQSEAPIRSRRSRTGPGGDEAPEAIAVVGMACRFPGAANVEQYWENLRQGIESIRRFTDEELIARGVPAKSLDASHFVKASPLLDDIDKFDAAFFGYAPKEAEIMDPQHRLFLECAWHALEHAGYDPSSYRGAIGVFGGASPNYYGGSSHRAMDDSNVVETYQRELANEKDYLTTRLSYKLNLRGPSLALQTACSTSLVATHVACRNLLAFDCDMALAGGVSINPRMTGGYFYQEGMIPSPDGHCRAFDAKAQGTVVGQGVGIVVLKRLSDALADGDTIHAVIRGSAVNNDGASRVGFTAPGLDGQVEVVSAALSEAGIPPREIGYIEAHGTGTPLGDPIEIRALTKVFRSDTDERGFCAVGSVKTNIGHVDAAAGVAGLIKTVLMLEHGEIPPSLHFETPNPNLELETTPFFVNTKLRAWPDRGALRRAGVSSFGLGGTNAHVVLEEPPPAKASGPSRTRQLLLLSAKTERALDAATAGLLAHLGKNPGQNIADVAYTLQAGRKALERRRTLVCADGTEAAGALAAAAPARLVTSVIEKGSRSIAFMFSGQGSQYVNMGRGLYEEEPFFRDQIDRCAEVLRPELAADLRELMFNPQGPTPEAEERLKQTSVTQPALFAIEYALAKLWMQWGIRPEAMIGHSIGEYVAACIAGVFSPEDALRLVAARGRLMQAMPPGAMLAVSLTEAEIAPYLNEDLAVAVINSPGLCVVSGEESPVAGLESRLAAAQVACRRVLTSHAFHSRMMEPVLAPFIEQVRRAELQPPRIPFLSNVTGTWINPEEATSPEYWAKHLRQTVRFSDGVSELFKDPGRTALEVGPGRVLCTIAGQHPAKAKGHLIIASTRHPLEQKPDGEFLLEALASLWRAGIPVDWAGFHAGESRQRVPLPAYAFERKRHWIEAPEAGGREPEDAPARGLSPDDAGPGSDPRSGEAAAGARPGLAAPPWTANEKRIAGLWHDLLGVRRIGLDDDFFELGGHSLVAVTFLASIGKEYGIQLPLASLLEAPTVRRFAGLLGTTGQKPGWSSLVTLNAAGDKTPFFLMHSHGGNVLEYWPLAHHLGKRRPIYALQAKGLDGSPIGEPRIEEMAARYLQEIKSVQPAGPYYLGGFCFGGFLALEAAGQLEAEGEKVALVVLINASTIGYPQYSPVSRRFRTLFGLGYRILLEANGFRGKSFRAAVAHLSSRGRRLRDLFQARAERRIGSSRAHSQVYHLERLAEAHDRAWAAYKPKPYEGRVLFFAAERQPLGIHPDPLLGWGGLLRGDVQVRKVPGFRQNMLDESNVSRLASILRLTLDRLGD